MFHESSKLIGHGFTPVRLRYGLAHTRWFNGLGKGIFGHGMELFGFEDLVH